MSRPLKAASELIRKLRIRVAPLSRAAVLAASTPPESLCRPGGPHDSRPGGRRYLNTDKLFPQQRPSVAVILTRPDHALIQKVYCLNQASTLTLELGFRALAAESVQWYEILCLLEVLEARVQLESGSIWSQMNQNIARPLRAAVRSALSSVAVFCTQESAWQP